MRTPDKENPFGCGGGGEGTDGTTEHHSAGEYSAPIVSDLHRIGGGFSVQFILRLNGDKPASLNCEWTPHVPTVREARRKIDPERYRAARHVFLETVAENFGVTVVCIELPGDGGAK